mgnify:FL=1
MPLISHKPAALALLGLVALPLPASLAAQTTSDPSIVVTGAPLPDMSAMTPGPELKGVITARKGDRLKITTADGASTIVAINESTRLKASSGLFGGKGQKPTLNALLNGLPVTVKTVQAGQVLLASEVSYKANDFRTAMMIRNGTEQQFAEQTAATQALRGRMADIDNYNIKGTTNVFFDTGKWQLSPQAKLELCNAAQQAEATSNALLLVVGYTDSVGSEDYNQTLSEKRANSVINYLQQACHWKPYRVLTPTGMAEADPLADNTTEEGKAQNRRVAVNILVSKSVEGL